MRVIVLLVALNGDLFRGCTASLVHVGYGGLVSGF
jgi:hypothetical protein